MINKLIYIIYIGRALFVIPILFMACGHSFEIFTIVAEIDDDMDLVFGFKNMVETEGMLNTRTGEYDFIGRSIPIFPQNDLDVPVGEKAYSKVKALFCDKLSGMICTKFFGRDMVYMLCICETACFPVNYKEPDSYIPSSCGRNVVNRVVRL